MKTAVYRRAAFNAAHRLYNPAWDNAKNNAVFGLCNNPNYHGHNYTLIVKVVGDIDTETGYVIDLKVLNSMIQQEIIEPFDHNNLNLDVPEFKQLNPTAENIARVIYEKLVRRLGDLYTLQVRLYETDNNFVEYPASDV